MDNVDEFFRRSHYNLIRILLGISGLWPYHTLARRRAMYIGMVLLFESGFIFQMLGVIEVRHDSFKLINCLPVLAFAIMVHIKFICTVYMLPKIKVLLTKMHEYYLSLKSDEEIKIQYSYMFYGQKVIYVYTGLMCSHISAYVLMLMMKYILIQSANGSNKVHDIQAALFYRVNYMVDIDTYYVPIFIHTTACQIYYLILFITLDVLYVTLSEYCCGLFAALRYRLENAFELEKYENAPTTAFTRDRSYLNIVYSVRRHAEVTQFIALMESVYSLPLLVQTGCMVLLLSTIGFQLIASTENISYMMKHIAHMNGLLINIFFENWQGQRIVDSSEKVYESVYNAKWYKMPIAAQKLLILIIMKSRRPSEITAGKIIGMSFVSFNTLLRAASSYLMLLRSSVKAKQYI